MTDYPVSRRELKPGGPWLLTGGTYDYQLACLNYDPDIVATIRPKAGWRRRVSLRRMQRCWSATTSRTPWATGSARTHDRPVCPERASELARQVAHGQPGEPRPPDLLLASPWKWCPTCAERRWAKIEQAVATLRALAPELLVEAERLVSDRMEKP